MIAIKDNNNNNDKKSLNTAEISEIERLKLGSEANIVASIYKNPRIIFDIDIERNDFSNNNWRVYYEIARGCLIDDKMKTLDEITVGMYLRKHENLARVYVESGGYDTIRKASEYINEENVFAYADDLKKWNCLLMLSKDGFVFGDRIREYKDISAADIYDELTLILQNAFLKANDGVKAVGINNDIDELIESLDNGEELGMPLDNASILTDKISGINMHGKIYGIGANTGVGKSTTVINYILPSVIKYGEKVVMTINEEDEKKVQKEMLVWIVNNHLGGYVDSNGERQYIHKGMLAKGGFSNEMKEALYKASDIIKRLKENSIIIIPLEKYTISEELRIIRKYSALGYGLFILDTFKESADMDANSQTWKEMERDMRSIYDVIKPSALNVTMIFTYQLSKSSVKMRHYSNADVGQAKNILDVVDCNIMLRKPFSDEYEGGRKEITYYRKEGHTRIPCKLKEGKYYMITFITKNRFGESDSEQIISEYDLSTNMHKDVGTCNIMEDY